MTSALEVNKDLLLDFIDESLESLGAVDSLFVELENSPHDVSIVDSIFRPIHSMKGNAAYFGLMRVKELSHRMESILDLVRQGKHRLDHRLSGLLLKGLDALRTILAKVRDEQKEVDDEDDFLPLLIELEEEIENEAVGATPVPSISSLDLYLQAQALLAVLPQDMQAEVKGMFARLRPEEYAPSQATTSEQGPLAMLRSALESEDPRRFDLERETVVFERMVLLSQAVSDPASRAIVREMIDIACSFAGSDVGLDSLAREMLLDTLGKMDPQAVSDPVPEQEPSVPSTTSEPPTAVATGIPAAPSRSKKEGGSRTMRISEESMDHFLERVGELMGLEEIFRYLGKRMMDSGLSDEFATDLRQATEQFAHLSSNLSKEVMELRRTEARPLLQKVPRLARDVAEKVGKKIEIRTSGEDVRIDKSYLELLDAPLMHMVRNACDHGIDLPKERLAAGKPEAGIVEVSVIELEDSLVMRVCDDGRGLNMDGLRRKAVELGIVKPEAVFGEAEAVAVLFHSGISTASEVTEISGRGVGMDVVKREIEGAGGHIEVKTTQGHGSVFQIVLPRSITTRISDGFLFRCGTERFVLPMRTVVETFPATLAKVSQVAGGGKMICFRNEILRMVDTSDLLETRALEPSDGVFVRVRVKDESCVFQVEEALGVQRTVVKPVEEFCRGGGIFAGAAMLGDGGLAMVLSEEGLAHWLRGS
ncbi:MAG: hypothetical protein RL318_832 [Fibrobacterota bacterium]|jgi:two-component system chemotaxis sensor kinase CheA